MADEGYCMKCREKRQFEGQVVTLKNGRPAAQGTCPVCGTKLTQDPGHGRREGSGLDGLGAAAVGRGAPGPVSSGETAAARVRSPSAPR